MFTPSEFINFLRHPHLPVERRDSNLLGTALLIYICTIFFIGIIGFGLREMLKLFFILPVDETLIIPDRYKDNAWIFFVLATTIVPILEETIFRLSLVFKPVYLSFSISILISLYVHRIANEILTLTVFLLLFSLIYRLATIYKESLFSFWNRNFKYLFYGLSLFFGLVHIGNYKYTEGYQYIISPLLVFPQIGVGFILSFTRIFYQKGFFIGIIYHIILNTISVSIFILSK